MSTNVKSVLFFIAESSEIYIGPFASLLMSVPAVSLGGFLSNSIVVYFYVLEYIAGSLLMFSKRASWALARFGGLSGCKCILTFGSLTGIVLVLGNSSILSSTPKSGLYLCLTMWYYFEANSHLNDHSSRLSLSFMSYFMSACEL